MPWKRSETLVGVLGQMSRRHQELGLGQRFLAPLDCPKPDVVFDRYSPNPNLNALRP